MLKNVKSISSLLVVIMFLAFATPAIAQEKSMENSIITRADFAQMLLKAVNISEKDISDEKDIPKDLKKDAPYAKAIISLIENNILKAEPNGKIYPEKPIKSIEAKTLIARTWKIPDKLILNKETSTADTLDLKILSWINSYFQDDNKYLTIQETTKILSDIFKNDKKANSIIQDNNEKSKDIKSVKVKGDMILALSIVPEIPDIPTDFTVKFNSQFSNDQKLHQTVDFKMPITNETVKMDQYVDKDYIYMNIPNEEDLAKTKWLKIKNPMSKIFEENFISNQDMLKSIDVDTPYTSTFLGTEDINGKKMHKIAFYTRINDISQFAKMFSGITDTEYQQMLEQAYNIIDSMFVKGILYIGADDGLVYSAEMAYNMSLQDLGLDEEVPFKLDAIKANMKFNYYDYNSNIEINIPKDAKDAEEITVPDGLPEE